MQRYLCKDFFVFAAIDGLSQGLLFVKVGVFVFVLAYRYSSTSSIYRQYYFDVNRTFWSIFLFIVSVILAMLTL